MKLAYLQAYEPLQHKAYISYSAVEFDLKEYMALELIKPLYGLSNSGDIWRKTFGTHNREDFKLITIKIDPIFYLCLLESERLIGMIGSYVDYLLRAGNSKFKRPCEITHKTSKFFLMRIHCSRLQVCN